MPRTCFSISDLCYIVSFIMLCFVTTSHSVVPRYCLSPLNSSNCHAQPHTVFSYYKPGSRCEIEVWRGCPTLNSFTTEQDCINKCLFRFKLGRIPLKKTGASSHYYNYYHKEVGIPAASEIKTPKSGLMEPKIIGGFSASVSKHPYIVRIRITLTTNENSLCSGSLVSRNRVLTAAHCGWDGNRRGYKYTLGFGTDQHYGGLEVNTKLLELHKQWDTKTRLHDIAIISFDPIKYTVNTKPIKLPDKSFLGMEVHGIHVSAAGFGKTGDSINPSGLNEVKLMLISNKVCQKQMPHSHIFPSMVCTSGLGILGTCGGDSGGPLVYRAQGEPILIGITSFGPRSCQTGRPSIYTRVVHYLSWIKKRL